MGIFEKSSGEAWVGLANAIRRVHAVAGGGDVVGYVRGIASAYAEYVALVKEFGSVEEVPSAGEFGDIYGKVVEGDGVDGGSRCRVGLGVSGVGVSVEAGSSGDGTTVVGGGVVPGSPVCYPGGSFGGVRPLSGGLFLSGNVVFGNNLERNRLWRAQRKAGGVGSPGSCGTRGSGAVGSVGVGSGFSVTGKSEAQKALEEKWLVRNKLDTLKLKEQLRKAEEMADCPKLAVRVRTEAEEEEFATRRLEKVKSQTAKYRADRSCWERRAEVGAVDKAIAVEMEVMDGQLSGKYSCFADKRTLGWAKTVDTGSSASSSAKKTVWSGSGASGVSDGNSQSVVSLEKYEELEKRHEQVSKKLANREIDIKRVTSLVTKLQDEKRRDEGHRRGDW